MKISKILLWVLTAAMMLIMAVSGFAEDSVVLNPGTLSGLVSVTGNQITSITVRVIDTEKKFSASITKSVPAGADSIDYMLTVEGGHDYYVIVDAYVLKPSTIRALFPVTGPVAVSIGTDVQLNLSMVPAFISGNISTGSSINTIASYSIYAYATLPEFDLSSYYCFTSTNNLTVPGDAGIDYNLLVASDTCYNSVRAYIIIDGLNYNICDSAVTTPAAGETLTRNYIINTTSAIISEYAFLNGIDVTYANIYGYANSPSRTASFIIPDLSTGLYTLNVDAGTWKIRPSFNFNLPDNDSDLGGLTGNLCLPYTTGININAKEELIVDFDITPGFIPGTLNLWGANTDFASAQVRAYGSTGGGSSDSQVDPDTGKFLWVCSPGEWEYSRYQQIIFNYSDDEYSNIYQYTNDSDFLTVEAGQTTSQIELTYGTITIQRYFYVEGEGTLSHPYIKATKTEPPYSMATGYGSSIETTKGQAIVTLLLSGGYSLEAFATVNGSVTEFGTVDIVVDEGDVVVMGGTSSPIIKITNPTNNEIICGDKVIVKGTATDDTGIEFITINEETVAFSLTANPNDSKEVGFSHEVLLAVDTTNIITVTVSDATDPITLLMTVISESCDSDIIECAVDIKPGSCPNSLNVKNKNLLPAAILGTEDFDVNSIDINTIQILGIAPVSSDYEDVGTPSYPFIGKEDQLDCTKEGGDDFMDLTLQFDKQQIIQAIEASGKEVADSQTITLPLTGRLFEEFGGNEINGEDVIIIFKKQ